MNKRRLETAKANVGNLAGTLLRPIASGTCSICRRPVSLTMTASCHPQWRCVRPGCSFGWLAESRGELYPLDGADESQRNRRIADLHRVRGSRDPDAMAIMSRYDLAIETINRKATLRAEYQLARQGVPA